MRLFRPSVHVSVHRRCHSRHLGSQKGGERDRVLGLFRRGRIDDATLDQQLDLIDAEAAGLQSAESLLASLRKRLDGPVPSELKRRIVEILVDTIQANTVELWGAQQSEIIITYRFSKPDEPAALVLPRSHRISSRNRPPEQLNTLGEPSAAPAPHVEVAAKTGRGSTRRR